MAPELMTPSAAAKVYPRSPGTLNRLAAQGRIASQIEPRTGRRLIDVASLEAYLADPPKPGVKKGQILRTSLQWPHHRIIDALQRQGPVDRRGLLGQATYPLNRDGVDRVVRRLHRLGLVEPCGEGRPERWRLTEAGVAEWQCRQSSAGKEGA